jgi:hypothetical protein
MSVKQPKADNEDDDPWAAALSDLSSASPTSPSLSNERLDTSDSSVADTTSTVTLSSPSDGIKATEAAQTASAEAAHERVHETEEQDEEEEPLVTVAVEAPAIRSQLILLVDVETASLKVVSLAKLPSKLQPAFDAISGRLSGITSQIVTQMRVTTSTPAPSAAAVVMGEAPAFAAVPLELTNDAVLANRSLSQLLNPIWPLAIVM